ncbi:unnamed protein product [Paramecium sonneborni]|uniref:Uncharacterized protein n=1 Tax=Paramecium sonneborni TaxID=65129 RepID=A0A8S1RA64_9CILI|nr:unnamed protein product [Paramecium sonneborni]
MVLKLDIDRFQINIKTKQWVVVNLMNKVNKQENGQRFINIIQKISLSYEYGILCKWSKIWSMGRYLLELNNKLLLV